MHVVQLLGLLLDDQAPSLLGSLKRAPEPSPGAFASRLNGLEKRMPGCYALAVHGRLPDFATDDDYEPEVTGPLGWQTPTEGCDKWLASLK